MFESPTFGAKLAFRRNALLTLTVEKKLYHRNIVIL